MDEERGLGMIRRVELIGNTSSSLFSAAVIYNANNENGLLIYGTSLKSK